MTAPLVLFDLDGTLAETAGDLMAALNVVLGQEGVPPLPVEQARMLLGAGGRALIKRGFATAGRSLTPEQLERLFADFLRDYESHIAARSHLFPGVEAALDRLEAVGYAFAVCTNKMETTSLMLLDALGVTGRFRAICGQDSFAFHKPDARTLPAVIAQAGGAPNRAVMVGDSITDIAAAKNAGIPVIAVDFGYTDVPVQDLGPDRVISHFDALLEAVTALLPPDAVSA
ncbi:phosphoglycolate phosphatase [Lichenihabitans sp. Uapishka_5]|uniref:HAD family hydrolase n=1 Tax=Lichenihabitans sp. Uapishka_5 TaxID=3037302 RepID=UPI0029E803C8|nr:HAD family hydrolase [Lichenihabitans sp. Uapishka_5]MDX7950733.1 phosphoglycolate phosphatase [Lichenihabitans sp. Uapishka_5]